MIISDFFARSWTFIKYVDNKCRPNPKYARDKIQLDISHHRNRAIVILELIVIVIHFGLFVAGKLPLRNCVAPILGASFIIFILLLSCRYHPEIFRVTYSIIVSLYGPNLLELNDEGVHTAWGGVQTYPVFVLLVTGSLWHFLFQAGLQLVLLNFLYVEPLKRTVIFMTPQTFTQSFVDAANTLAVINTFMIACVQLFLQNAYQKAYMAEKTKEEAERQKFFLLGFSHELRNLINSLLGNINLAVLEDLPVKVQGFLRNADLCGELLLHLVNNILDSGKIEVGDLEINPTITDMSHTMEKIWSVCSELINRKNLRGTLRIQKTIPPALKIDHYRLTQIFLNLVGNAVKFTETGRIEISMEWIPNTQNITRKCFEPVPFSDRDDMSEGLFEKRQCFASINNEYLSMASHNAKINQWSSSEDKRSGLLRIIVRDTGCGMGDQSMDQLFQKFSQVTTDLSKRKLGTGLGLFITKELVRRMNGEIKVFSRKNQGSCFILCIPVSSANEETIIRSQKTKSLDFTRKRKVLIVDDEPFSQGILKNFFDKIDIDVLDTAEHGQDAYQKYVEHCTDRKQPCIVTMDLNMPVMDGKKAAEKIREFEREKGLEPCLLIIISGNCSDSEMTECLNKNGKIQANAFLKKPANFNVLLQIVSRHFGNEMGLLLPRQTSFV